MEEAALDHSHFAHTITNIQTSQVDSSSSENRTRYEPQGTSHTLLH